MNQETMISFELNTIKNNRLFEEKKLKTHMEEVTGVSICGFWQQAKTTKDTSLVTCKLCKNILDIK